MARRKDASAAKLTDMRAEAASWDDWSVSNPPPIAESDKWHVQIAADDVKVVSLEQLDDLFRLSIVDSETNVWQSGMAQWQPLRVIAGLDEQPAPPPPKRTPPKPPMRTAAMSSPPAAPMRTMVMPPSAPPPRSISPSVRPAPPVARPVELSPTSFYPEPIQAKSPAYAKTVAYAAPIAFAAPVQSMNSVRPLVVSRMPAPVATTRGGGGFGRFLVGVALLAGVSVTAYRNDFLRDAAHQAHQDALYARLETALGGPAFGTVRALEQTAAAQPAAELALSEGSSERAAISDTSPSAPSATGTQTAALSTATPPVVSLESLAPERKAEAAAKSQATPPAPAVVVPTPSRAAASFVQPKPVVAPAPAKAAPAKPIKAVVEKPEPVPQKPASEMTERERLNAAIGQSMMQADAPKPKGKKSKAKNSDYDPLNPNL